ncbi:hypothetical protein BDZ89DRAFT_1064125 [Hymenopellis radicata]|nr:hypothetical protein BDZ89DRAFT_1064125 [Hymenopellis radicata]
MPSFLLSFMSAPKHLSPSEQQAQWLLALGANPLRASSIYVPPPFAKRRSSHKAQPGETHPGTDGLATFTSNTMNTPPPPSASERPPAFISPLQPALTPAQLLALGANPLRASSIYVPGPFAKRRSSPKAQPGETSRPHDHPRSIYECADVTAIYAAQFLKPPTLPNVSPSQPPVAPQQHPGTEGPSKLPPSQKVLPGETSCSPHHARMLKAGDNKASQEEEPNTTSQKRKAAECSSTPPEKRMKTSNFTDEPPHVEKRMTMQNNSIPACLHNLNVHERLMLASLVKCMKREGVKKIEWAEALHQHLIYTRGPDDLRRKPNKLELAEVLEYLLTSRATLLEDVMAQPA